MKFRSLLIISVFIGSTGFDVNAENNTFFTPMNIIGISLTTNACLLLGLSAYWDNYSKKASVSQSTSYYIGSRMALGTAIASAVSAVPFFTISIIRKKNNNKKSAVLISPESVKLTVDF